MALCPDLKKKCENLEGQPSPIMLEKMRTAEREGRKEI